MLELGLEEVKTFRTVTLNRTGKTRIFPRYINIKLSESSSRVLIINLEWTLESGANP